MRPQLAALTESPERYAAFERRLPVPAEKLPEKLDFVTHRRHPLRESGGARETDADQAGRAVQAVDAGVGPRPPVWPRRLRADRLPARHRGQAAGVVVTVLEKSWGPNFLRFGTSLSTDLQGETFFNLDARPQAGLVEQPRRSNGATRWSWAARAATRPSSINRLTIGNNLFASAYGSVQRAPEFIFEGDSRIAEYDVLNETAGIDLGLTIGTSGEMRGGFRWLHLRGDPTIAISEFPTVKQTETGGRLLLRWDTLDNPYFPRNGVRGNAEVFSARARRRYRGFSTRPTTARAPVDRRCGMCADQGHIHQLPGARRRHHQCEPRQPDRGLQSRRLPAAVGVAHQRAVRQLHGLRARRRLSPDRHPAGRRARRLLRRVDGGRQRVDGQQRRLGQRSADRGQRVPGRGHVARTRSTSPGVGRAAGARRSTCTSAGREVRQPTLARAQPRGGLASVHADEGARDAAAGADRARRRRVARRLRRPALSRRA